MEGLTVRLPSSGAWLVPELLLGQRRSLYVSFLKRGSLFTLRRFPSTACDYAEVTPGNVSVLVREGITEPCVWMDWGEKEPGGSARQSLSAASITPIVPHVSSMQWEESAQVLPHTDRRGRGRRGGIFMGYLLDFPHPVVLNLCSGWGRSRSCWKPPGLGMWLWWRNCWVERKEYWVQAPVPSHYPTY